MPRRIGEYGGGDLRGEAGGPTRTLHQLPRYFRPLCGYTWEPALETDNVWQDLFNLLAARCYQAQ